MVSMVLDRYLARCDEAIGSLLRMLKMLLTNPTYKSFFFFKTSVFFFSNVSIRRICILGQF